MSRKIAASAAFVISAVLALGTAMPAAAGVAASSPAMQQRIDAALAEVPGGVQTAWNEVSWDDGAVVLTLAPEGGLVAAAALGSCASGTFCAYSAPNYAGSKLTFSTCTSSHSVSGLGGPVQSIANARSSGKVQAKNGSTVVATVYAGTRQNTNSTITSLSCS